MKIPVRLLALSSILVLLLVAFAARHYAGSDESTATVEYYQDADKVRIERFWEALRQATRHRTRGEHEAAIASYREALRYDPQHEDALYYLAGLYLDTGRYDSARVMLERMIAAHPTSSRAHSRLGDVYFCFDARDLVQAERAYRAAAALNLEETGPQFRLGQVALAAGDYTMAQKHLDVVVRADQENRMAKILLGFAEWKRGNSVMATRLYREAARAEDVKKDSVVGEGDRKHAPARQEQRTSCPAPAAAADAAIVAGNIQNGYRHLEQFFAGRL